MRTGIYFNGTTNEITSVTDADGHPGPQWHHVSDDVGLGLLAIRQLLVERGLVGEGTTVYWYLAQPEEATSLVLPCEPVAEENANGGTLTRLRAALRGARRPPLSVR